MIKLIKKENLTFEGGYLIDQDGNVYNTIALVTEMNRVFRMCEIVKFAIENQSEIQARACNDKLAYRPSPRIDQPYVSIPDKNMTTTDGYVATMKEIFQEQRVQNNRVAARRKLIEDYPNALRFAQRDHFLYDEATATDVPFEVNPLKIDSDVIEVAVYSWIKTEDLRAHIEVEPIDDSFYVVELTEDDEDEETEDTDTEQPVTEPDKVED